MTTPQTLLVDLKAQVDAGDVDGGMSTLSKIKVGRLLLFLLCDERIPALPLTPPFIFEQISLLDNPDSKTAMEALELGVLLSVAAGDLDAFARNFAQLQPYYTPDVESPRKCHILGLNLMFLLIENRLSEFHAEMELLTEQEATSAFVSFPITLERQLMVGSYDEVLKAHLHIPDASYEFFMDNLLQTVRDSIADCMEVSYKTMKLTDAATMMKFTPMEELMEYIKDMRDDWIIEGDSLCFQPPPVGSKAADIPAMSLIAQSLSYATELERII